MDFFHNLFLAIVFGIIAMPGIFILMVYVDCWINELMKSFD